MVENSDYTTDIKDGLDKAIISLSDQLPKTADFLNTLNKMEKVTEKDFEHSLRILIDESKKIYSPEVVDKSIDFFNLVDDRDIPTTRILGSIWKEFHADRKGITWMGGALNSYLTFLANQKIIFKNASEEVKWIFYLSFYLLSYHTHMDIFNKIKKKTVLKKSLENFLSPQKEIEFKDIRNAIAHSNCYVDNCELIFIKTNRETGITHIKKISENDFLKSINEMISYYETLFNLLQYSLIIELIILLKWPFYINGNLNL